MLRDDTGNGGGRPKAPRNVLGERLEDCSIKPMTGFFRDGCCNTSREDIGSHTVCAVMTAEFLEFSKSRGNDLSTPMPQFGFPGLRPGDRWCLCAERWREALEADQAPAWSCGLHTKAPSTTARSPISSGLRWTSPDADAVVGRKEAGNGIACTSLIASASTTLAREGAGAVSSLGGRSVPFEARVENTIASRRESPRSRTSVSI